MKSKIYFLFIVTLLIGCSRYILIGMAVYKVDDFFKDEKVKELVIAAVDGDTEKMETLVKEGVDVNHVGKDGMTPLFFCLASKKYAGFEKLLELGANPNYYYRGKTFTVTILDICIASKDSRFLKSALDHGGNPNFKTSENSYPLIIYAIEGNKPIENFLLLLEYGADINYTHNYYDNPIGVALIGRHYKHIIYLIEHGSDFFSYPELRKKFIGDLENSVQFEGSEYLKEQQELVEYLEKKYNLKIHLKYPEGRKKD